MRLSVIIVNYNVRYFLDQCLESVFGSDLRMADGQEVELEVMVVDNASVDGSVEMVRERYAAVQLIANKDNKGFAAANNQALRVCTGDWALLLNPDTVVERDTLARCVDFFRSHPQCGGLTVKMVNGEGRYLRESKRGFPTAAAAFYKMCGLAALFPHSRRFAAYYMGHLPDDEVNPVDILPGAFLMISREALNKVGLLDEAYFMYGEDIDFSWRIRLAGFENYYMPTARIIHYKGESTKHSSMNYVYTFYNAMSIFVKRYYGGPHARLFSALLRMAIWLRACVAWVHRVVRRVALPAADFAVAFAGFVGIKHLWASFWAENVNYYPAEYTWLVIPAYILLLMAAAWLYGGYERPVRLRRLVRGMAVGSLVLLLFYSLLDESQRYSRALLLMGCAWTLLAAVGIRAGLSLLGVPGFDMRPRRRHCCIVVGGQAEVSRVRQLYEGLGDARTVALPHEGLDGRKLCDAVDYYKADEVVFCSKDLSVSHIIDLMAEPCLSANRHAQVDFKIVPTDGDFIIGSGGSIRSAEDLYTEELHTIATPLNRRNKRLFDAASALLLLILTPVLVWFQKRRGQYVAHCWQVLTGQKTWVGAEGGRTRKGVFGPEDSLPRRSKSISPELKKRLHLRYMRSYKLSTDIQILVNNLFNI